MSQTKTITITAANSLELAAKAKIIEQCGNLPMEDLERIGQLVTNPKALTGLKKHWIKLKIMFG